MRVCACVCVYMFVCVWTGHAPVKEGASRVRIARWHEAEPRLRIHTVYLRSHAGIDCTPMTSLQRTQDETS